MIDSLHESEARFRLVANNTPVMIYTKDTEANCNFINRTWMTFTGQQEEAAFGQGWADLIHPEERQRIIDLCLEAVLKQQDCTVEFRMRRADGQYRFCLATGTPSYAPDG